MKYIKTIMSNPHQQNIPMAMMFDPNYKHDLLYGLLQCDPVALAHLHSEPSSAGFLRFGREGLRSYGYSTTLNVDAKDDDGTFIMNTFLETGGEFIRLVDGGVVILTKGFHDFVNIEKQNSLEVRGSFKVKNGGKSYPDLVPEFDQLYIPKAMQATFDKEQLLERIYDVINCD